MEFLLELLRAHNLPLRREMFYSISIITVNRLCYLLGSTDSQLDKIAVYIEDFSKTGWTNSESNTKKKIIEPCARVYGG